MVRTAGVLRRFIGRHSHLSPAIILVERAGGAYLFDRVLLCSRNPLEAKAKNQSEFASASRRWPVYGCYSNSSSRIDNLRCYFPDVGPRNNAVRLLALRARVVCRRRGRTVGVCSISSDTCASLDSKTHGTRTSVAPVDRCRPS